MKIEIFREDVIGSDVKSSFLILYNKIRKNKEFPSFMELGNMCAIYKGRGDVNDFDSGRGIFLVSIFRTRQ
jgi:hypothetical protein